MVELLGSTSDLYRPEIEAQLTEKKVNVDEETERYIISMLITQITQITLIALFTLITLITQITRIGTSSTC